MLATGFNWDGATPFWQSASRAVYTLQKIFITSAVTASRWKTVVLEHFASYSPTIHMPVSAQLVVRFLLRIRTTRCASGSGVGLYRGRRTDCSKTNVFEQ